MPLLAIKNQDHLSDFTLINEQQKSPPPILTPPVLVHSLIQTIYYTAINFFFEEDDFSRSETQPESILVARTGLPVEDVTVRIRFLTYEEYDSGEQDQIILDLRPDDPAECE